MTRWGAQADGMVTAIEGIAAAAWFSWGDSVPQGALDVPMIAGATVSIAVAIFGVASARASRDGNPLREDPRIALRYRLIVLTELAFIVAGAIALASTDRVHWLIVWTSFVVGVHFVPLAMLFERVQLRVTGLLVVGVSLAAFVVGIADGIDPHGIAVAGAGTGIVLLVSALSRTARRLRAPATVPTRVPLRARRRQSVES